MPLSIDQSGQLRLSFEFTLRCYPDFPGQAADALRESRAAGHGACFDPPSHGAPSWHPAMAVALACVDAGEASPEHGCSDLRIRPRRVESASGLGFDLWSIRCELALDRPELFLNAARFAMEAIWNHSPGELALEEAAYELFVASNTRDYAPLDAGIELIDAALGNSTLAMAHAWVEARALRDDIASPAAGTAPPRL